MRDKNRRNRETNKKRKNADRRYILIKKGERDRERERERERERKRQTDREI